MSSTLVTQVISEFLSNANCDALALKGDWGIGKTHLWNKQVDLHFQRTHFKKYAYVTLFGLSTIQELRSQIYLQAISSEVSPPEPKKLRALFKNLRKKGSTFATKHPETIGIAQYLPYGKLITEGLDICATHGLSNTLVCIDDFERVNETIKTEEILGLISDLKTHKDCKVALIFNEAQLESERKVLYRQFKEKVIDVEVTFEPLATESAYFVFTECTPRRLQLLREITKLNIRNIRILKRIAKLAEIAYQDIRDLHELTQESIFHSLVLFAWLEYSPSNNRIPKDFLRSWNTYLWQVQQRDKEHTTSSDEGAWADILESYGFTSMCQLDLEIEAFVERGYRDDGNLRKLAIENNHEAKATELHNAFSEAWNLFHGSLENNQQQFKEALITATQNGANLISPENLHATVVCLRELGYEKEASDLIDYYIKENSNSSLKFDLKSDPFSAQINDIELLKKFSDASVKYGKKTTLFDAAQAITKNQGWDHEILNAFYEATEDQLCDLFRKTKGRSNLRILIKWVTKDLGDSTEEEVQIVSKARSALKRIAAESTINAMRLSRYGIHP